jgi:hypothetical protein
MTPDDDDTALEVQVNLDGSVEFVPAVPGQQIVVRGEPEWERRVLELVRAGESFTVICYPESGT